MARGSGTGGIVLNYFTEHAGVPLDGHRVAKDTGLSVTQALNAMSNLVQDHPELGLVRVRRGTYKWEPVSKAEADAPANVGDVYEGIGKTRAGGLLVRHTDSGIVYKLTEL